MKMVITYVMEQIKTSRKVCTSHLKLMKLILLILVKAAITVVGTGVNLNLDNSVQYGYLVVIKTI